ncbi:bacteriohemerythrin [Pseudothauera lacus]|uniref:Bacteriohemerythrin n=1 Tax=Pseudothauera lacus TaxID=2136175 RepID=A0A2T4IBA6_9RHOO|nr:bacteriohemerythrin [Pseudothauera lacus]PTD95060.1 bacteriohemerythrin [Pseudothauera lacus]
MTFMQWTAELELGAGEIDGQHRWLVDQTNALHDELSGPAPRREVIGELLEGLADYTQNHFIAEEVLFERHRYPETAAHKAQHDAFTTRVIKLLMRFEQGETVDTEVLDLLRDWLTNHICKVDRAYVDYLRAHGAF